MFLTPDIAFQLAMQHLQTGHTAQAEVLLRQLVAAQPGHCHAWHRLGVLALLAGRVPEAVEMLGQAIAVGGRVSSIYSDFGAALFSSGRAEEACGAFEEAIRLQPDLAHAHRNLGDALVALGFVSEGMASYERALALIPTDAGAWNNLGNAALKIRDFVKAEACYRRATELEPRLLQAQSNLGDALLKLDRPAETIPCAERVIAMDPQFPGGHQNRAIALMRLGDFSAAEAGFRRAIQCDPTHADSHLGLGILCLLHDRYQEGWREYEWRWRSPLHSSRLRGFNAPVWNGGPLPGGTLLLHADQGFGDTLQFLRYLPLVCERARARQVVLECQSALFSFLQEIESPGLSVVPRGEILPPFDAHVSLLSLPFALQQWAPVPLGRPIPETDATKRAQWQARLGPRTGLRVGLAWAGNPEHDDDRRRSIDPRRLAPLFSVEGVQFISLQVDPTESRFGVVSMPQLADFTSEIRDFTDSAALMEELDLIISVDTATIHLAGLLSRPVWVLLPDLPDWRWRLSDEQTPWYPTMRLFRQERAGDWDGVLLSAAAALRALVATS